MGSLSIWHWFFALLFFGGWIIPAWKIVSRSGHAGAWSLLSIIPVIGFIFVWIFAFKRWPVDSK